MDETMGLIHKLANERLELYMLAGHTRLTDTQRYRVQEITDQLAVLWDRHRRELAANNRPTLEVVPRDARPASRNAA
ncbi:MAG: hypothetical protein OHK0046_23300 [Anaerolineae bacterium]